MAGIVHDGAIDLAQLIDRKKFGRYQTAIVVWLFGLMVLEGYDMQVLAFAAPSLLKLWNISRADFSWVLSANLWGYLAGAVLLSSIGDTIGRRRIILAGVALFGAFTLAAAFANSPLIMCIYRVPAGIGLGGAIPSGIALAAEFTPSGRRATVIGLMFVGYTLGAAGGGFIGSASIAQFGWPSVFLVGGFAAAPVLLGLWVALPESVRFLSVKAKDPARILATLRRLYPAEKFSDGVRFTVAEETHESSPLRLFSGAYGALTALLWFAMITSFMGHYFLTSWLPTLFNDAGLTVAEANFGSAFFQVGGALGSFLVAVMLDRWGRHVVGGAFFLAAPFVILLGIMPIHGVGIIAAVFMAGLFVLGGQIGLNATAGTIYPTYIRSTGTGWALGIGRIGSISGPIIGGHLMTAGFSRPTLFILTALPLLACGGAAAILTERERRDGRATNAVRGYAH